MQDGTYLYQNGRFIPISVNDGYWVAERELSRADLQSGMVVGFWTDSRTGRVYLDKVRLVRNLTRATALAVLWKQIAIWSNSEGKEIRISQKA